jgi:hypothetical protein
MFLATGIIVFAMQQESNTAAVTASGPSITPVNGPSSLPNPTEPLVLLNDGKGQRVVSFPDFLKLANAASSVTVDNQDQTNAQLLKLINLQNQVATREKQIKLLEEMVKRQTGTPGKKDSWWESGVKNGFKNYKEMLTPIGKYLAEKLVSFTINGALILGSAWVAYKIIFLPMYCNEPGILAGKVWASLLRLCFGLDIPEYWYSKEGTCSGYFPKIPIPQNPNINPICTWEAIQRSGGIIPSECVSPSAK